jgi:hypothetical protein
MTDTESGDEAEGQSSVDRIIEAIQALPEGSVVTWSDDAAPIAPGVHRASWIDVQSRELEEASQVNWLWTIVTPEEGQEEGYACFNPEDEATVVADSIIVTPDKTVWTLYGGFDRWFFGPAFITATDEVLSLEDLSLLEAACENESEGTVVESVPAWSFEKVSEALNAWAARVASRPDISFTFDPEGPRSKGFEQAVIARDEYTQAVEKGADPGYQIAENVRVSDAAFDSLLEAPPEVSAKIVRILRGIAGEEGLGR